MMMMMMMMCKRANCYHKGLGWSGGVMVLGKLPVPGRPTYLDNSGIRAYCACGGAGGGCLDIFSLTYHIPFLSRSLLETARYRMKYCLKGPLNPNTTNQPIIKGVQTYYM